MPPKKRDWSAGLGYTKGQMDGMDEYAYDPSAPFDETQLLEAISSILSASTLQALLYDRNFIAYIEGMFRIGPYSDEATRELVEVMLEAWNERLSAYAVWRSKVDEEARIKKAKNGESHVQTTEQPKAASNESSTSLAADGDSSHEASTGDDAMASSSSLPSHTSKAAKPGDEPPLPTVDETKFAYSAWLMHEDLQHRLLAAAQYIDHFQVLNLKLSDDPALDNVARIDAFRVLYKGGRSNIYAAKRFLDSLRRQIELEGRSWKGQGAPEQRVSSSNATQVSSSDTSRRSQQHDNFDLSDGESEPEDDATSE